MLVSPTIRKQRQEDCEFEAGMGCAVRPFLKQIAINKQTTHNPLLVSHVSKTKDRQVEFRLRGLLPHSDRPLRV